MATFYHRPTPADAERWTGDNLDEMVEFAGRPVDGVELDADYATGVLWVTHRAMGVTDVFPIARGHMLLRLPSGRLVGMASQRFDELYAAPRLVPV